MFRYLKPLHQSGYAILMFDVRSHGESDREKAPTVKMFRDDVIAAVQYARQYPKTRDSSIGDRFHADQNADRKHLPPVLLSFAV